MSPSRLLALALVALAACGGDKDPYEPPRPLTAQEQALVTSSNSFGFDLFEQAVSDTPDKNVFLSPLSVSMALGMAYNGARNTTAAGMADALDYGDLELAEIDASYQSLMELLVGMDPDVTLEVANSVWYRQELTVLDEFLDACRTYFAAVVEALDFDGPGAADRINGWVAEETRDKIDSIIDQDDVDASTMMFLVDAVYFNGNWTTRFDNRLTQTATFHGAGGDSEVLMMHSAAEQKTAYMSTEMFQAARLPYGHADFAMTILLPAPGHDVDEVVAGLDAASWAELQAAMTETDVRLGLPHLELEYEATLNDTLAALGMTDAFDPATADFSGITGAPELYIDEVKHKTYLKVNEEGTEAAAATSVELAVRTATSPTPIADRPFVLVVHDTHSQALLFMGRILDL